MNDLEFVMRVVDMLEDGRLRVWLFGGWAEELRGLRAPCEHVDVDFLYPGRDFARVDRFLGETTDTRPHKRTFEVEGIAVELLLVQKDERGWFTQLPAVELDAVEGHRLRRVADDERRRDPVDERVHLDVAAYRDAVRRPADRGAVGTFRGSGRREGQGEHRDHDAHRA